MDSDARGGSPSRDRDRSRRGDRLGGERGSRFDGGRDRSREKDSRDTRRIYISK